MTLEEILSARPAPGQPRTYEFPGFERTILPLGLQISHRELAWPAARVGESRRAERSRRRAGRCGWSDGPRGAGNDGGHAAVPGSRADRGRRAARCHTPRGCQLGRFRGGRRRVGESSWRCVGAAGRAGGEANLPRVGRRPSSRRASQRPAPDQGGPTPARGTGLRRDDLHGHSPTRDRPRATRRPSRV